MKKIVVCILLGTLLFTGCGKQQASKEVTDTIGYEENLSEESDAETKESAESDEEEQIEEVTMDEENTSEDSVTKEKEKDKSLESETTKETAKAENPKAESGKTENSKSDNVQKDNAKPDGDKKSSENKDTGKSDAKPSGTKSQEPKPSDSNTSGTKAPTSGGSNAGDKNTGNANSGSSNGGNSNSGGSATPSTPAPEPAKETHQHEFVTKTVSEATCESAKRVQKVCATCGYVDSEYTEGEALGHDFSIDAGISKQPTCTSWGERDSKCSRCGVLATTGTVPPSEHSWDGGRVLVEGNCQSEHIELFTCTVCGFEEKRHDNRHANDHDWQTGTYTDWNEELHDFVDVTVTQCHRCGKLAE
ncbi:MAG: hypothetical protein K6G30_14370 [Acetatifactor sp.]|nr:hypothetical protein [Acetatifactor sp.]